MVADVVGLLLSLLPASLPSVSSRRVTLSFLSLTSEILSLRNINFGFIDQIEDQARWYFNVYLEHLGFRLVL